jgi:hypothetical protein
MLWRNMTLLDISLRDRRHRPELATLSHDSIIIKASIMQPALPTFPHLLVLGIRMSRLDQRAEVGPC